MHLQSNLTSEEIVLAKREFEDYSKKFRVKIRHYHDDNGIFKENTFMQSVKDKRQATNFFGVNNHLKNGK